MAFSPTPGHPVPLPTVLELRLLRCPGHAGPSSPVLPLETRPSPRRARTQTFWPRPYRCQSCHFATHDRISRPDIHYSGFSDTDGYPTDDPCPVLTLATVRPDSRTTTWCGLVPKMEGWFSQTDVRWMRLFPQSSGKEPEPIPSRRPLHGPSSSTQLSLGSRFPRVFRAWSHHAHHASLTPGRHHGPFFCQLPSTTASSPRSDSHDHPSQFHGARTRARELPPRTTGNPPKTTHMGHRRGPRSDGHETGERIWLHPSKFPRQATTPSLSTITHDTYVEPWSLFYLAPTASVPPSRSPVRIPSIASSEAERPCLSVDTESHVTLPVADLRLHSTDLLEDLCFVATGRQDRGMDHHHILGSRGSHGDGPPRYQLCVPSQTCLVRLFLLARRLSCPSSGQACQRHVTPWDSGPREPPEPLQWPILSPVRCQGVGECKGVEMELCGRQKDQDSCDVEGHHSHQRGLPPWTNHRHKHASQPKTIALQSRNIHTRRSSTPRGCPQALTADPRSPKTRLPCAFNSLRSSAW